MGWWNWPGGIPPSTISLCGQTYKIFQTWPMIHMKTPTVSSKCFSNVENICLQYVLMAFVFTVSEDLSQYFCPLSQNLPVFVFLPKCSGICISPQLSICYFVFDSFRRGWLHFTAQSVVDGAFVQRGTTLCTERDYTLYREWAHFVRRGSTLCGSAVHCNL